MILNRLPKLLLVFITSLCLNSSWAQQVQSLGIFTGFSIPYTYDAGINSDSRYRIKWNAKFAPVGIHYGVDYQGYGFMIDPCFVKIGQNFNVININGGDVGERDINLTYFHFPAGFKFHIIDLSFFKVSFVGSIGLGVLLNGSETITHRDSKLKFPTEVTGVYPSPENDVFEAENPGYFVEYDGVLVPNLANKNLLSKGDYKSFQLFGGIGFRSDWDITETWRVSFDVRGNMSLLEPRQNNYIDQVKRWDAIYDIYGKRRDLYLSVNVGFARTIEIEPRVKDQVIKQRRENKSRKPERFTPPPKNKNRKRKS